MEFMELLRSLLIIAGTVAVLALAYFLYKATKTLTVLDSTLKEADATLAEVRAEVLPLANKVGVTIDAINMELLRIDEIITSVENATKKVEHTSNSISGLVNAPVDAVADFAGRVRSVIKGRRAEAQDARKVEAALVSEYYENDFDADDAADEEIEIIE